ncbi:hypothetical protein Hanom_Chr12g01127481 [Helianthus anomalus]
MDITYHKSKPDNMTYITEYKNIYIKTPFSYNKQYVSATITKQKSRNALEYHFFSYDLSKLTKNLPLMHVHIHKPMYMHLLPQYTNRLLTHTNQIIVAKLITDPN